MNGCTRRSRSTSRDRVESDMRFSRRTLARLSELIVLAWGHGDLTALFYEFHLEENDPTNANKRIRSITLLKAIEDECVSREANGFIIEIVERLFSNEYWRDYSPSLLRALQLDGFVFHEGKLVLSEPGPVALAPQLSALEEALEAKQCRVALRHYQQAIDNFTNEQFEACNGQLRSFLEAFFMDVGRELTQHVANNVGAALQQLRNAGHLDESEWNMCRYYWGGVQDNGPHAGLTDRGEALFRLHMGTAIGRYLVEKLE